MDPSTSSGRSLISRLEAAQEGSRELDAEIVVALRIKQPNLPEWADKNFPVWRARPDGKVEVVHPDGRGGVNWEPRHRYTTSIDDALTLVPEGWASDIWLKRYNGHHWEAALHRPSRECYGRSKSPALSLVIASLKARERE